MEPPTRVLVVDDDPGVCRLVRTVFEVHGWRVVVGEDGHEAVALGRRHLPDLIVLDVMMPGRDGISACAELRRHPRTADIPIVLLSARSESRDIALGMRVGADAYVTKPFEPDELIAVCGQAVSERRARRALGA